MNGYQNFSGFESSSIKNLWYSIEKKNLIVQYTNGSQYRYDDVSVSEWNGLKSSDSKGKFLNESIKSKPYQKMMLHD